MAPVGSPANGVFAPAEITCTTCDCPGKIPGSPLAHKLSEGESPRCRFCSKKFRLPKGASKDPLDYPRFSRHSNSAKTQKRQTTPAKTPRRGRSASRARSRRSTTRNRSSKWRDDNPLAAKLAAANKKAEQLEKALEKEKAGKTDSTASSDTGDSTQDPEQTLETLKAFREQLVLHEHCTDKVDAKIEALEAEQNKLKQTPTFNQVCKQLAQAKNRCKQTAENLAKLEDQTKAAYTKACEAQQQMQELEKQKAALLAQEGYSANGTQLPEKPENLTPQDEQVWQGFFDKFAAAQNDLLAAYNLQMEEWRAAVQQQAPAKMDTAPVDPSRPATELPEQTKPKELPAAAPKQPAPGGAAASVGGGALAVVPAGDTATTLKRASEQGLDALLQDSYDGVAFDANTKAAVNEQARKAREEAAAKKLRTGDEDI